MNPKEKIISGQILFIGGIMVFLFGSFPFSPFILSVPLVIIGLLITILTKGFKTIKLYGGMLFLVLGLLIYFFHFLPPLFLSYPLIINGLLLVIFSGTRLKLKLIACLTPFAVAFLFIHIRKGEDEIYLIPQGYNGHIRVHFNEPNGALINYENGKRIYTIPETGILFTNQDETNYNSREYYFVNESGNRKKIKLLNLGYFESYYTNDFEEMDPLSDSVGVFLNGMRGSNNGIHNYSYVGTYSDYKKLDQHDFSDEYINKLKNELQQRL